MDPVEIRIRNTSSNELPRYATGGSAGMDLCAFLSGPLQLQPMERALVPTGLYMEIPAGYEAQIRPRSGIALKQGLTCLNSPGTIDSDYRGEIKILLVNLSGTAQVINPGERIAQMVVQQVARAVLRTVTELAPTERSDGGFGSTGKD
jgi:dUTP pyrophosphatase